VNDMDSAHNLVAQAAAKLAAQVPGPTLDAVARAIEEGAASQGLVVRTLVVQQVPHLHYRSLVIGFLDSWQHHAPQLPPVAVALALRTAAHAERLHREAQAVELVWTGPEADAFPVRRTEQAVLQVLDSAQKHITLVSYAVYRIPRIRESLVRAAGRGVRITVVIETPDKIEGAGEYSTLKALGSDVANCCTVYYWPKEKRGCDDAGKFGILHVKCAVADGRWLFLSSANLTEYAFTINMEFGVLVTGGHLPGQIEVQFEKLIEKGFLAAV